MMVAGLLIARLLPAGQPVNIARGKPYALSARPNYRHCTEAGDKVQLTDGEYVQGYFWVQPGTVGWRSTPVVKINIDLGAVKPISGISFNTAAGVAGVNWPLAIYVLVSRDGKTFYLAGDLVEFSAREKGDPKADGYGVHRFASDRFKMAGRHVTLMVAGSGPYTFVDEIEVHEGPEGFLDVQHPGRRIVDMDAFYRQSMVTRSVRRRLRRDLKAVRDMAAFCGEKDSVTAETFEGIEKAIGRYDEHPGPDFRTVFPMNDLHRRIFKTQGALWRTTGLSGLVAWHENRWDMLSPTEMPKPGKVELSVAMMRNEFRSAAFNISNAGIDTAKAQLAFEGLPGGATPTGLTVHEVLFTDTQSGVPVAAAMPVVKAVKGKYEITIESGMTRQVWLTFHSRNLAAGTYQGSAMITPGNHKVPITLRVYPFLFPDQPALHLGGWDYTDADRHYQVTPQNRTALIRHLREHFVDTPWATRRVLAYGRYDKQGRMIEAPETIHFKKWLERWPGARNYFVFAAVGASFAGFPKGTPAFENAVAQWIAWWVEKIGTWGVRPGQLGLLLVDEPHAHEQDDTIIAYAKVIRKAAPGVVIWEDPTWREPWKARPALFELSHVLCPNRPMWLGAGKAFADFYTRQRQAGRVLWFYSCSGPGKLLDPYSYHRLQHWFCWRHQAAGSGFWAFGDSNGASSWNEYLAPRGAYTPVFLDARTVTHGKHMEAIREGVEDHQYLAMLKKAMAQREAKQGSSGLIKEAKALLDGAAERVLEGDTAGALFWQVPKDRGVADRVRREILDMMMQLAK